MRILLGCIVFVVGVGALGWWGAAHTAPAMEDHIRSDAVAQVQGNLHPLDITVRGRDIRVTGLADTEQDAQNILNQLNEVSGRRVVRNDLTVLPVASPFVFQAVGDGSSLAISGNIPTEAARDRVATLSGVSADALTLASGAPSSGWVQVVDQGVTGLRALNMGTFTLEGMTATLSGLAKLPNDRDAALTAMSSLPEGYSFVDQIELEDDGTPMRLTLRKEGDMVSAQGKLPMGMSVQNLETAFGASVKDDGLTIARISGELPTWQGDVTAMVPALSSLVDGALVITGSKVGLTGQATRIGRAEALEALAHLDRAWDVSSDVTLVDDGRPFQMVVEFDGSRATASGKLPYGMTDDDIAAALALETSSDFEISEIASEGDAWPQAAQNALSALSKLQNGSLHMVGSQVDLSGLAVTPNDGEQIADLLNDLPEGYMAMTSFEYMDDGTPSAFDVTYDVDRGARVSGKLPAGLSAPDIAQTLNLMAIQSTATQGLVGKPDATADALSRLSSWLPELDKATLVSNADAISLAVVAAPGVDVELLEQGLMADFPQGVTITSVPDLPNTGTLRINARSGDQEQFTGLAWVPVFDFTASLDMCQRETIDVLQRDRIAFVTGKARLDAKSVRAVNALAGLIRHCQSQQSFSVEVAGHTDAVGGEDANQRLSQDRADAVMAALLGRSVEPGRITAVGYGESAPIADNTTEAGRAANRRTEIVWVAVQPVEPETEGE